jgi:hypothetical protein
MIDPAGIPALVDAIRHMHDCGAKHVETVHVHEKTPDGREPYSTGLARFEHEQAHAKASVATKRTSLAYARPRRRHAGGPRRQFAFTSRCRESRAVGGSPGGPFTARPSPASR